MQYKKLGKTDLNVSEICLGTMTWGQQNSEKEAHRQMDIALERGINFFDTAELYPVPPMEHTQGKTEQYIGTWFNKTGNRDKIILSSKVVGSNRGGLFPWFRNNQAKPDRKNIEQAINESLQRLQTDYIDVYHIHWPERDANYFGVLEYPEEQHSEDATPIEETLEVMSYLVKAGKIRCVGVSNETAWGLMTYLKLSETKGLERVCCIQNPYNLLNRSFEIGLAEVALREECSMNAYSPLAFGILSGKYIGDKRPAGARQTLFGDYFSRYGSEKSARAAQLYVTLAIENDLDPAQMALAYVNSRSFVTSNIIGATTEEQLISNIESADLKLSPEIIEGIEAIHREIPNPAP